MWIPNFILISLVKGSIGTRWRRCCDGSSLTSIVEQRELLAFNASRKAGGDIGDVDSPEPGSGPIFGPAAVIQADGEEPDE